MVARSVVRSALLAALAACARAQFEQVSADAVSFYDNRDSNFGSEDKMIECNDQFVFVDLDARWAKVCDGCTGGGTPDECTVLVGNGALQPVTLAECQGNCTANANCTEVNYNSGAIPNSFAFDCVLRSCKVNPPTTLPDDTGYSVYTFNRGTALQYDKIADTWTGFTVRANACPSSPTALVPRDAGYTVGIAYDKAAGGGDRLLVIGGDANETNVYYSDDCGRSWSCFDGPQPFSPRGWAPIVSPQGIFPGDPVWLLGGDVNELTPSVAMFGNTNGGTAGWARPACSSPPCAADCEPGTGTYCLPGFPVYAGQVVADWSTLWLWLDDDAEGGPRNSVWWLNSSNYGSGFTQLQGADSAGALGRRAYVRGSAPGAGCFFSTDFTAGHLWERDVNGEAPDASSSNAFATARTPAGPWVPGTAPWAPRASAAVVASETQDRIWVAGGFPFVNGVAQAPAFGDVWTVDATVCLLGANGAQCSGHALDVDLDNLVCNCLPNWAGDDRCSTCTPGLAYNPAAGCPECPVAFGGGPCNVENGWGVCDPVAGCVCAFNHDGPNCGQCAAGHYGAVCAACAACDPVGGACDGSGSSIGTGACECNPGYTGADCSQRIPPPAAAAAGLSTGGAVAVSLLVIGAAVGGGLYVFATFFGGGPALAAAAAKARAMLPSGFGGGTERVGLLAGSKAGALSPVAAQARFGGSARAGSRALASSASAVVDDTK